MGTRLMKQSSFATRLLIPLFVIVAVGLAVHAYISFRSTRQHFLKLVEGEAARSSGLIRRATQDAMLLHRLDDVQTRIEELAREPEIAAIRVYDKRGIIVISSDQAEIGRRGTREMRSCEGCHRASGSAAHEARIVDGSVLRQLSAIDTGPGCNAKGCHDVREDERVLGILSVEMSLAPMHAALSDARAYLMWTTFLLVLVIGFVGTIVVRRTMSYQRLRDWTRALEAKVEEEKSELKAAQKQVLHMEKMASLGKLSATVAHELNNPISGMLTYARLVERELEDQPLQDNVREEVERYLHLVQRECSRCGGIVQNLLTFARRSNAADPEAVDLNEIIERSVMLVRHHIEIKGICIHTDLLPGDATMVAVGGELEQAIVALLVNAIEATPTGGQLRVNARGTAADVYIDISDTGVGIPAEALPLIFEPFFTTKNNESGSGLGLAVVYGIVHRHGGTIEVASQVGAGTTFHMRLPRQPVTAEVAV